MHGKHSHRAKPLHRNTEVISKFLPLQIALGVVLEHSKQIGLSQDMHANLQNLITFRFKHLLQRPFACCFGPVAICISSIRN